MKTVVYQKIQWIGLKRIFNDKEYILHLGVENIIENLLFFD